MGGAAGRPGAGRFAPGSRLGSGRARLQAWTSGWAAPGDPVPASREWPRPRGRLPPPPGPLRRMCTSGKPAGAWARARTRGAAPPPPRTPLSPGSYGPEPAVALAPEEAEALELVRRRASPGSPAPRTSGALVAAARLLAERAAGGAALPLDRRAVRDAQARALSYDPAPAAFLARSGRGQLRETLAAPWGASRRPTPAPGSPRPGTPWSWWSSPPSEGCSSTSSPGRYPRAARSSSPAPSVPGSRPPGSSSRSRPARRRRRRPRAAGPSAPRSASRTAAVTWSRWLPRARAGRRWWR